MSVDKAMLETLMLRDARPVSDAGGVDRSKAY